MKPGARSSGFTLLETLIVLGLLSAFCLFLTQLLRTGVGLFDEGESGQDLADRAHAAGSVATTVVHGIVGPSREMFDGQKPDARLLVQRVPLGFVAKQPLVQCVRATVQLEDEDEQRLLADSMLEEARLTLRGRPESEIRKKVEEMLADSPRLGRGTMLLIPWPAGDAEGSYLDLRRILLLPGQKLEIKKDRQVEIFEIEDLSRGDLPASLVEQFGEKIASGILHFDLEFWSQHTRDWNAPREGGPERVWDSARAGLLSASKDPRENFTLDLSAASLTIPSDDVWPRWVRITLVVDRSPSQRPDALLAREIGANDTEIPLLSTERLPDLEDQSLLKIGPEWVQYKSTRAASLQGVVRAQRGTIATTHPAGTPVRAGKTVVLYVPLACGRDNWNG